MRSSDQILLTLLRIAAGNGCDRDIPADFAKWQDVFDISSIHGVAALAVDGLSKYYENSAGPISLDNEEFENVKFEWFGSLCQTEDDYASYEKKLAALAGYYDGIGVKMMVLKGYGVGLDWPVPSHRQAGDIDIWLFGKQKYADMKLHEDLGIEIDNSHHHHSVFMYEGLLVENHYNFINVYDKPSSRRIERRLKLLSPQAIPTDIPNLFFPTPNFNALFLLKHCSSHFASSGIGLRQVLDWLFFVRAHHNEIDWDALYEVLRDENMHRFANSLNAIGVKYLGFDPSYFPELEKDVAMVDRIMRDMLQPEFPEQENGTLLSGLTVKPRRWWHNRWKHRICCSDSMFLTFVYGVWSKLMKPSHFIH